jgi:putative CocE/NonD family hydrolase
MRDGVVLRSDVFRLRGLDDAPVLVCRTPYGKWQPKYQRIATALCRGGYLVVVQDIRGLNASDGEWTWHLTAEGQDVESRDGYDTCEWAARLRGCDGRVGTWGNSYPSWCSWRMAAARPPSLKALFTSGFPVHTLDATNGIFEVGIRLGWHHHMAVSARRRAGDLSYPQTLGEARQLWALERGKWIWQLPLDAVPDKLFGPAAGALKQYWRNIAVEFWALDDVHPQVDVPTCTLTGWWDRLNDAAEHYPGMVRNGPPEHRGRHRLIIGPWIHDVEIEECWTAAGASAVQGDYITHVLRWYDHEIKGVDNGLGAEPPVKFLAINEGRWRFSFTWPPAGAEGFGLYLHSTGAAHAPGGDGVLSAEPPKDEPPDRYVYDPRDPVMTLHEGQLAASDQAPLQSRRDILVYQTAPLDRELLVVGRPSVALWVSSDCPDTDFVARLIEVRADGSAINLSHGVIRARYRRGYGREEMLTPGRPTELRIPMLATGVRLGKGSRVRLDITSSDFPSIDRNHNTGRPFYSDQELRIAKQIVFHDREHQSRLSLPVVAPDATGDPSAKGDSAANDSGQDSGGRSQRKDAQ